MRDEDTEDTTSSSLSLSVYKTLAKIRKGGSQQHLHQVCSINLI